jgi:glycosyltransferase involved in cell wall biosynthesis
MNLDFFVSVIIPVYNAAPFVRQAVESALAQPEVGEVLLVEDGSPDNALEICQQLAAEYPQVTLLRHPNGENRGAGASRNLGMRTATSPFLAFLDADDYYLPGRFMIDTKLYAENPSCEGVYHAISMHIEDSEGLKRWNDAGKTLETIKTINAEIPPDSLAEALLYGSLGHFSIDGLSIKKTVLERAGMMREDLRLHQDTEWILRLAITAQLYPGSLTEPVSRWRVHSQNRISSPRDKVQKLDDNLSMWEGLYSWCKKRGEKRYLPILMHLMLENVANKQRFEGTESPKFIRRVRRLTLLVSWLVRRPRYIGDRYFWRALSQFIGA